MGNETARFLYELAFKIGLAAVTVFVGIMAGADFSCASSWKKRREFPPFP
jgi:hypothetical protein